jgi:hypothetical protein
MNDDSPRTNQQGVDVADAVPLLEETALDQGKYTALDQSYKLGPSRLSMLYVILPSRSSYHLIVTSIARLARSTVPLSHRPR